MKHGISVLSVIPMRKEPNDHAEMVNQVLFGEHFAIVEQQENWSKIVLSHDDYEGWISNKQWTPITEEAATQLTGETPVFVSEILDIISRDYNHQPIVIGSILPLFRSGYALINNEMYRFDGPVTTGFSQREKILENALIYLNAPYLWGGRSPLGIDCSGLTQMVYRLQGIRIPRDAWQQEKLGKTQTLSDAKPGDLCFFENTEGKIIHVGILMNKDQIIHASGKVRIDNLDEHGIIHANTGKYTHQLSKIKAIS